MTENARDPFAPPPLPADLRERAEAAGWPAELIEKAQALRVPRRFFEWWVTHGDFGLERAQWGIRHWDRLTFGHLRGRDATLLDNDRFAELWDNAPERIGDWEITVERRPNAFAQFVLQDNVSIPVIEDNGLLVACVVWAHVNVIVGGQRLAVHCGQGLRVHQAFRGEGYGNVVRAVGRPVSFRPTDGQFHYVRSQNYAAIDFFKHTTPSVVAGSPEREGDVPGISVTVQQYPRRPHKRGGTGIRLAQRSDVRRCVSLTNRTHRGYDLFRPRSEQELELRLDSGYWGERPAGWAPVYGWDDFWVVEDGGRIVACGGLWDRGRDIRERWRNHWTNEERTVSYTALLDFGFERGREDAMARLIEHFIGEADRLGRDFLIAPLEQFPRVAALLEHCAPVPETRALGWLRWGPDGEDIVPPQPAIARPFTDLSYW